MVTPFLISLTMSPSIHTLSNECCRSIQATWVTFFSWKLFLGQVCGMIFSRMKLSKASLFWCQKVVGLQVPLEALVDDSLHSFPNTAGETYGAVTGCLFGVFPFLEDWDHCCFPPCLWECACCPAVDEDLQKFAGCFVAYVDEHFICDCIWDWRCLLHLAVHAIICNLVCLPLLPSCLTLVLLGDWDVAYFFINVSKFVCSLFA